MRIIAGSAGGRIIATPKGILTRPTLDRVRESLFSILTPHLQGARVLDLFAGSGALGLECLSRGAAFALFVDSGRAAQKAVAQNIGALGFSDRAAFLPIDYKAALARLSGEAFTLAFLDPPYAMSSDALLLSLKRSGCLAEGALIAYEHARDTQIAPHFPVVDARRYGDTVITFMKATGGTE